jgi:hypothetical protein
MLANLDEVKRQHLSSYVRWHGIARLGEVDVDTGLNARRPGLRARADKLLIELNRYYPDGERFFLGMSALLYEQMKVPVWARNADEVAYLLNEVLHDELQFLSSKDTAYRISPKGLTYLEGHTALNPTVGFVAMWFDEKIKHVYEEVFSPAISSAGFVSTRIDRHEHNGKIDDEIIATIRRSRFVVADFTGHRGGVYYEAGFAHGLGLPVIFTCRKDQISELHFDVRQFNCILWEDSQLEKFRAQLMNRILATIPGAKPT